MQLHYGNLIEKAKDGEFDVIMHGANCFNTMGAGIAKYIKINFPQAYEVDQKTIKGDKSKLGHFTEATFETKNNHQLTVINAYTQYHFGGNRDNFDYENFPQLLQSIKEKYGDKKIGIPLIGCGLAGGDEPRILKMIRDNWQGVDYKLVEIDTNRQLNLGTYPDLKKNVSENLIVISPREKAPEGFNVINTTSRDTGIGQQLSPFNLKDIELYEGKVAKNMENAWQFSKVYKEFADAQGNPTAEYFKWAQKGWNDSFAHRYANGKGNIPLYSYWKTFNPSNHQWEKHHWDYVTARKNIYFPLYAKAVIKTDAFHELKSRIDSGEKIALWDFDGYKHEDRQMSYEDVVNSSQYKCGHAFVIYGLLTGQLKVINDDLVYDFDLKLPSVDYSGYKNVSSDEPKYTFFFHLTSPFSNFHPSKFEYRGYTFISNEQFMMFSKAKTFGDEHTAQKIMNIFNEFMIAPGVFKDEKQKLCFQLSSEFAKGNVSREQILNDEKSMEAWNTIHKKIKSLGRDVKNYDDKIWAEKRPKVVGVGAREKFNQNLDLKNIFLNTGNTIMVEASPYDKIWGNGLSEAQSKITPQHKWPGLNLLGNILTDLKIHFKNEISNSHKKKISN